MFLFVPNIDEFYFRFLQCVYYDLRTTSKPSILMQDIP